MISVYTSPTFNTCCMLPHIIESRQFLNHYDKAHVQPFHIHVHVYTQASSWGERGLRGHRPLHFFSYYIISLLLCKIECISFYSRLYHLKYSETSNNGLSERRTNSMPPIAFPIEIVHLEPPRSGYLSTPDNGQPARLQRTAICTK